MTEARPPAVSLSVHVPDHVSGEDLRARIDDLRALGAARLDPVGWRVIEAMLRRLDNQFEKQLGKTPTDHRFVSYQDRPEFWMPTPVERWPCQQLHQGAPGIQCQLATVAQEQCVGRCLSSIWSLCFGWHCRFVADGPIFRPVHWPAPSKRRSLEFGRYDARRRLQPSLRFHCGRP